MGMGQDAFNTVPPLGLVRPGSSADSAGERRKFCIAYAAISRFVQLISQLLYVQQPWQAQFSAAHECVETRWKCPAMQTGNAKERQTVSSSLILLICVLAQTKA